MLGTFTWLSVSRPESNPCYGGEYLRPVASPVSGDVAVFFDNLVVGDRQSIK